MLISALSHSVTALVGILGLEPEAADYNYQLLSLYFVRIPGDEKPRLMLPMYFLIVILVCFSLILVIHNSFALSMNSRIRQFGIFSSIGATPGQIRICLIEEALMLSCLPIAAGLILGMVVTFFIVRGMSAVAENIVGGRAVTFSWHPLILIVIILLSLLTVVGSAWIPARKLSRVTPLEAIRGTGELMLKRRKRAPFLFALFGMEGELAGCALKAQRKTLRTTTLSLTLAFLGFMLTQCLFTLSAISTEHTYFERYQDVWDVMVTVKDTKLTEFQPLDQVKNIQGAKDIALYQKAEALCALPKEKQGKELLSLGGVESFSKNHKDFGEDCLIEAPIVILDDESFEEFCRQSGVSPRLDGTILLNRFWDSKNSNFRYPKYIPYVNEDMGTVKIFAKEREKIEPISDLYSTVEIPVLALTGEPPVLREEYEKSEYPLVNFIPLSLWREIKGKIGSLKEDLYVRILAEKSDSPEELNRLEEKAKDLIGTAYDIESENRIQEKIDNDKMINGYKMVLGMFCGLLAVIGIAHVFSNTLGFLHQRKREFARYMSVGLTPEGMIKVFGIEALILVGRPLVVTLMITLIATAGMIKASCLNPMEFLRAAPAGTIALFLLIVFGFVALAYYLGGKKVLGGNIAGALREELG
ncbi:MAG: ABC transporter permease [Roseburia sp.]|nr:ABC transporter permease [Roseburia sp.]